MKDQKIISGSFAYVTRASRDYIKMGYKIVKTKHWSDNKYTLVLELN